MHYIYNAARLRDTVCSFISSPPALPRAQRTRTRSHAARTRSHTRLATRMPLDPCTPRLASPHHSRKTSTPPSLPHASRVRQGGGRQARWQAGGEQEQGGRLGAACLALRGCVACLVCAGRASSTNTELSMYARRIIGSSVFRLIDDIELARRL